MGPSGTLNQPTRYDNDDDEQSDSYVGGTSGGDGGFAPSSVRRSSNRHIRARAHNRTNQRGRLKSKAPIETTSNIRGDGYQQDDTDEGVNGLEGGVAQDYAGNEGEQEYDTQQDNGSLSKPELEEAEAGAGQDDSRESEGGGEAASIGKLSGRTSDTEDEIPYRDEGGGRFSKLRKRLGNEGALGFVKKHKTGSSAGGVVALLLLLFFMNSLSSFKVIHFGEILAVTGYSRVNGIFQERTTQNIFDASIVEGEGSVNLRGKTLVDRIKMRNLDAQITELGRSEALRFEYNEGKMVGVRVKGQSVSLDSITQELGYGEKFTDVSSGFSKLRPKNIRAVMDVRAEFTRRVQTTVGDALALEPRAVRGRVMATISDNIGFKFSRWRQAGREFAGKTPKEAAIKDAVDQVEKNSKVTDIDNVSGETRELVKEAKAKARFQKHLEKTGGVFDDVAFSESYAADLGKAAKVQEVATNVGTFVLVASIACMVNDAARNVGEVQKNNEISAEKEAADALAAKDQNKAGKVRQEALAGLGRRYNGAENSASYQRLTGQPVTGETVVPNLRPNMSPTLIDLAQTFTSPSRLGLGPLGLGLDAIGGDDALDKIDATFCGALLSPTGAVVAVTGEVIVQAVIGFFTAGGGTFASEGAAKLTAQTFLKELGKAVFKTGEGLVSKKSLGTLAGLGLFSLGLNYVVGMLSGTAFSPAQSGPRLFENQQIGTNLLQSRRERAQNFGRPVKTADAIKADQHYSQLSTQYRQNHSFFARYFSPSNPFSVASLAAARIPSSGGQIIEEAPGRLSNVASVLNPFSSSSIVRSLFAGSGVVYAADNVDKYSDIQQWSYSSDELEKMRNDPSYGIVENSTYITDEFLEQKDSEIGKCYDPAITQAEAEELPECSAENLAQDDNFRYRLFHLDQQTVEDSEQSLKATAETTPSGPVAAANNKLFVVGDSLTVGMKSSGQLSEKLQFIGWSPTKIEATSGDKVEDALPKLDADVDAIKQAGTAVVMLGTNNVAPDFKVSVKSMVDKLRSINPSIKIYWMNALTDRFDYEMVNSSIQAQASPLNYTVIDWAAEYRANKAKYPMADGVHHTAAGYLAKSDFLLSKLGPAPTAVNLPGIDGQSQCAAGSESVGQHQAYFNGTAKQITLCAINDLPIQQLDGDSAESIPGSSYYIQGANKRALVSSTISDKIVAMVQKAKADGTPLTAISSFRTNQHQTAACGRVSQNRCSNGGYALPGFSAHQSGEAIDFLDSNRNSTANCRNSMQGSRCVGTDAVWKWLNANAVNFGLKQLPSESWHWSTSGT